MEESGWTRAFVDRAVANPVVTISDRARGMDLIMQSTKASWRGRSDCEKSHLLVLDGLIATAWFITASGHDAQGHRSPFGDGFINRGNPAQSSMVLELKTDPPKDIPPYVPAHSNRLAAVKKAAGGNGQPGIGLLTLPEVLPPWEHVDYDVHEEYLRTGTTNLGYAVRHPETCAATWGCLSSRPKIGKLASLHNTVRLVPDASRMLPKTRAARDRIPPAVLGSTEGGWHLRRLCSLYGRKLPRWPGHTQDF
jgi:hypothetical protein